MNEKKQLISGPALFAIVLLASIAVTASGYAYYQSHKVKNTAGRQTEARSNAVAAIKARYMEGARAGKTSYEIGESLYYFTVELTGEERVLSIALRNRIECINMTVFSVQRASEHADIYDGALALACKQIPITNGYFAYFSKGTNMTAEAPETASAH